MIKRYLESIRAPGALLRIVIVCGIMATITYVETASFRSAIIYSLGCFGLLQIGYFAGIVYLVYQERIGK